MMQFLGFLVVVLPIIQAFGVRKHFHNGIIRSSSMSLKMAAVSPVGGKIVVSGIGAVEEDEFMLGLLSEQGWDSVVLTAADAAVARKRFLTRTARYSGLLNVLTFAELEMSNITALNDVLSGSRAWIVFNVSQENIADYSKAALDADISRVMFTTSLPEEKVNDTVIPEFETAISEFSSKGKSFTGIRHGAVVPGSEDNSYEIVNATTSCVMPTVERGVLARVVAELLCIDESVSKVCGVSSSNAFAAAYLDILRSSGLTRQQEVKKIFTGGIDRVARLTVAKYEEERRIVEEKQAKAEQRKLEEALELEMERNMTLSGVQKVAASGGELMGVDFDEELPELLPTEEQMIDKRTEEILKNVWIEYDTRMFTKSTPKSDFFDANREAARVLAIKEIEAEREQKLKDEDEIAAQRQLVDRVMDVNRRQYSKLLALEKKEMQNQKELSDVWVKYVYLLLEVTMSHCKEKSILFHNMDEFQQTLLLRSKANELRKMCNLPDYEIVYDPLDATAIVEKLSMQSIGIELGLQGPADELVPVLNSKYGDLLKNVVALRGASQIIEMAIETLKRELPAPPPTVTELKQSESREKQKAVSTLNLEAIKNRGKPFKDGDSVVRKM